MNNPYFQIIKQVVENGLKNQVIHDGDYYNDDGFLICGKCGQKRQDLWDFDDGSGPVVFKAAVQCECEKEEERRKKQEEKDEKEKKHIEFLKKYSMMDARFLEASFDDFDVDESNERNYRLCKRYASVFDKMLEEGQGLLLWGSVGTGKSYAAACIANELIKKKKKVVMTSFTKILEILGTEKEESLIEKLENAKLVIFDDLGAERNTSYALEKVYNIIDGRYRSRLPMILTTNLTLQEMLDEEDVTYSRIYDRIFEVCYPTQFTGSSRRKEAASRKFSDIAELLKKSENGEEV